MLYLHISNKFQTEKMEQIIEATKTGMLLIFLRRWEVAEPEKFIEKIFRPNMSRKIVAKAKESGIQRAHLYYIKLHFEDGGSIIEYEVPENNSNEKLLVCVELLDEKEKLEQFVLNNKKTLNGKLLIFREVERWIYCRKDIISNH
jgi:PII-like signaling protein